MLSWMCVHLYSIVMCSVGHYICSVKHAYRNGILYMYISLHTKYIVVRVHVTGSMCTVVAELVCWLCAHTGSSSYDTAQLKFNGTFGERNLRPHWPMHKTKVCKYLGEGRSIMVLIPPPATHMYMYMYTYM